jgi:NAD-dependent SIR2 family protein deacetylase
MFFQAAAAASNRRSLRLLPEEQKKTAFVATHDSSFDYVVELLMSWLESPHRRPCVTFLLGAGISVAAGYRDFRSRGGMSETLRPELLTAGEEERDMMRKVPTYVNTFALFEKNPIPFLEVWRPLILGHQTSKPTLSHRFIQVLHEKGAIRRTLYCI